MRKLLAALTFTAALLAAPGSALADTYSIQNWTTCPAQAGSVYGAASGSYDDAGRLYIPCGEPATTIHIYDAAGEKIREVATGLADSISDVAPSPDGAFFYVATGKREPRRFNRQPDGTYLLDANWRLAPYKTVWGGAPIPPSAHFIAVDGAGRIYITDGSWTENETHDFVTYNADGTLVPRTPADPVGFGGQGYGHYQGDENGAFWNLRGIAVTRDGQHVYLVDGEKYNRVQRWDRDAATGGFAFSGWQLGTDAEEAEPPVDPPCVGDGTWSHTKLASPYDVALDAAGNVYVLNTTCHEVLKFTSAGVFVTANKIGEGPPAPLPHGFAVSADGSRVYVASSDKMLVRNADDPCGAGVVSSPGVTVNGSTMTGTSGPDVIVGTAAAETLRGLGGHDTICGRGGYDTISGGGGDDHLDAGSAATGNAAEYGDAPVGVRVDLRAGGPQNTGHGNDTLINFTQVFGSGHADVLRGRDDNAVQEYLAGMGGADRIYGGNGHDFLTGGDGDDWLDGGGGADRLRGGDAVSNVDTGSHDVVSYASRSGGIRVSIDGVADDGHGATDDNPGDGSTRGGDNVGLDVEEVTGGDGADQLTGSLAANVLRGRGHNDVLRGLGGPDVLSGGDGSLDMVTYDERTAGVRVGIDNAADDGNADDGPAGARDHVWKDVEGVTGTAYGDRLAGSAAENRLLGRQGNDTLLGYDDRDNLVGGSGNDYLRGGEDSDALQGDAGFDRLFGDAGNDAIRAELGTSDVDQTIDCGANVGGFGDHATVDAEDPASVNCEEIANG